MPDDLDPTDDELLRGLAAAVLKRALDDLTVRDRDQRQHARRFLLDEFPRSIWSEWVTVPPRLIADVVTERSRHHDRRSER